MPKRRAGRPMLGGEEAAARRKLAGLPGRTATNHYWAHVAERVLKDDPKYAARTRDGGAALLGLTVLAEIGRLSEPEAIRAAACTVLNQKSSVAVRALSRRRLANTRGPSLRFAREAELAQRLRSCVEDYIAVRKGCDRVLIARAVAAAIAPWAR